MELTKGERRDFETLERILGWIGLTEVERFTQYVHATTGQELTFDSLWRHMPIFREYAAAVSSIRVFQMTPEGTRQLGSPSHGPELTRSGGNLPAVIDMLQTKYPKSWERILSAMKAVLPGLVDIKVGYTARRLALTFKERGIGRMWEATEVSDGTMQTLALLTAIHDERSTGIVIEEPENAVHPWIVRRTMEACLEASKDKQILLTTHSPVVIDLFGPRQVFVMWKAGGESRLSSVAELDPSSVEAWKLGEVGTFEFLDSGAVDEAVPPGGDLFDAVGSDEEGSGESRPDS